MTKSPLAPTVIPSSSMTISPLRGLFWLFRKSGVCRTRALTARRNDGSGTVTMSLPEALKVNARS